MNESPTLTLNCGNIIICGKTQHRRWKEDMAVEAYINKQTNTKQELNGLQLRMMSIC